MTLIVCVKRAFLEITYFALFKEGKNTWSYEQVFFNIHFMKKRYRETKIRQVLNIILIIILECSSFLCKLEKSFLKACQTEYKF